MNKKAVQAKVQKVGDSMGVIIRREEAKKQGLKEGDEVLLVVEKNFGRGASKRRQVGGEAHGLREAVRADARQLLNL